MTIFVISFRIAAHADHRARHESLVDRIHHHAAAGLVWEETACFCLIESEADASSLALDLYLHSRMDAALDKLLVISLSADEHATQGATRTAKTLDTLMARR
jgi:hypothetical protein